MKNLLKILEHINPLLVLVGLVFVGLELRQNSAAVQFQTRSQISIAYAELLQTQRLDQGLGDASINFLQDEPTPREQRVLRLNILAHLRLGENSFYQLREGNYSDREFEGELHYWQGFINTPLNRQVWEQVKNDFSPDFRAELDALVK